MNFDKMISMVKGEIGKTIGQDNLQKMEMFQRDLARAAERMEKVVEAFEDNYEEEDPEISKLRRLVEEFADELLGKLVRKYKAGFTGWDNNLNIRDWEAVLNKQLCEETRDYLDIAAYAIFLWYHQKKKQDERDRESAIRDELEEDMARCFMEDL